MGMKEIAPVPPITIRNAGTSRKIRGAHEAPKNAGTASKPSTEGPIKNSAQTKHGR